MLESCGVVLCSVVVVCSVGELWCGGGVVEC